MLIAGIPLSKLLQKLGVHADARWVHFSGPQGELPEGKAYETSLELERCTNPADMVMLAFKQNDRYFVQLRTAAAYIGQTVIRVLFPHVQLDQVADTEDPLLGLGSLLKPD